MKMQGTLHRAFAAYQNGNFSEAEFLFKLVLTDNKKQFDALYMLGLIHAQRGNYSEGLRLIMEALRINPKSADAYADLGQIQFHLHDYPRAAASYKKALALNPRLAVAHSNYSNILRHLKRDEEALVHCEKALEIEPKYADAWNNHGNTLYDLSRFSEALASFDSALAMRPDDAEVNYNRGLTLHKLRRFDEALASFERTLAVRPDHTLAFSGAAHCVIQICDMGAQTRFAADLKAHVSSKKSIIHPFVLLGYNNDLALQLRCARTYIENEIPLLPRKFLTNEIWRHDRLRVAYLSADFYQHATAYLMAELFERHDRLRFEIIGVSFGIDNHSETRKRLVAAFDQFHDVRRMSDEEVAKLLHELQVDIAIDLKGYTQDSRPGILAHRPAPIQVNYLGFPATMGTEFIDYIIADKVVAPFEHQKFYAEQIVHLPDCYQVNDTKRKIAEPVPTRQESGLPQHAFVFCCFNNNWKITPEMFDVWMRLLHQVEGSVLWLIHHNQSAERNLRKEAQRHGIDPLRLVFAGELPLDKHLARHRSADLFLDTLPYNAHTTASDALWAGLPVLTCKGEAFAGRVAASLLRAVGVPELITSNLKEYESLALQLAYEPALLAEIKAKLDRNRETYPLFNTERFTRHIESAYTTMWESWRRGEIPKSFSVEPIQ